MSYGSDPNISRPKGLDWLTSTLENQAKILFRSKDEASKTLNKKGDLPTEVFLRRYLPAQYDNLDHIWLSIGNESTSSWYECSSKDAKYLLHEMKIQEDSPSSVEERVQEIATILNYTSGKWTLNLKPNHVNIGWKITVEAFEKGVLNTATAVKVTTKSSLFDSGLKHHKLCIHTSDFRSKVDVLNIGQWLLENVSATGKLVYKPDIYTHLGIYFHNELNLKPYLFTGDDLCLESKKVA